MEKEPTRRERLKSALYLRLKKRNAFKTVKGEKPSGFLKIQFVAKYQKNWRGDPLKAKKFKKSRTVPKKLKEGILQSRPLSQMLEKVSG